MKLFHIILLMLVTVTVSCVPANTIVVTDETVTVVMPENAAFPVLTILDAVLTGESKDCHQEGEHVQCSALLKNEGESFVAQVSRADSSYCIFDYHAYDGREDISSIILSPGLYRFVDQPGC